LQNDKNGLFSWVSNQTLGIDGVTRTINNITVNGESAYILGRNNNSPIVIKKLK